MVPLARCRTRPPAACCSSTVLTLTLSPLSLTPSPRTLSLNSPGPAAFDLLLSRFSQDATEALRIICLLFPPINRPIPVLSVCALSYRSVILIQYLCYVCDFAVL